MTIYNYLSLACVIMIIDRFRLPEITENNCQLSKIYKYNSFDLKMYLYKSELSNQISYIYPPYHL